MKKLPSSALILIGAIIFTPISFFVGYILSIVGLGIVGFVIGLGFFIALQIGVKGLAAFILQFLYVYLIINIVSFIRNSYASVGGATEEEGQESEELKFKRKRKAIIKWAMIFIGVLIAIIAISDLVSLIR